MPLRKITSLTSFQQLTEYLGELQIELPADEQFVPAPDGPMARPLRVYGKALGNRFAVLPMEGWDGTTDGRPSEHTFRRWRRFGQSGAKLIWGGEAVAVQQDGRANPNQLLMSEKNLHGLEQLRNELVDAHQKQFGRSDDLIVGLQLTHSGRFARPHDKRRLEPRILYRHPILDRKFGLDESIAPVSDDELDRLVERFVEASVYAQKIGFEFVDIKHCHGYFGHELLSSLHRPGKYGGSFENRTRFLREIVAGIHTQAPGLHVGVRLSIADMVPYQTGEDGVGCPHSYPGPSYAYAFGGDGTGLGFDLAEPHQFMDLLESLGIKLICSSVGSPYYNPHIQRPAWYPPSDGYRPPEDPLVGVSRQISLTAQLKQKHPQLVFVGSGYSYLQEWLGNVGQAAVARGLVDSVGLGRMVLTYPDLPADLLAGRPLQKKIICRTFSDCTTAPRNGMISGCFPLDDYYRGLPERNELKRIKLANTK